MCALESLSRHRRTAHLVFQRIILITALVSTTVVLAPLNTLSGLDLLSKARDAPHSNVRCGASARTMRYLAFQRTVSQETLFRVPYVSTELLW